MKNILLVFLYACSYFYMHYNYLYKYFHYMGYKISPELDGFNYWIAFFFVICPIYLYKKDSVLAICYVIFYLLLYIPILITFLFHYNNTLDFFYYAFFFFVSFVLIFSIPIYFNSNEVSYSFFRIKHLLVVNILFTILIVVFNFSQLSFVSFEEVYEHRGNLKLSSSFMGYIIMWNTYIVSPVLLITGLVQKNKLAIVIGFLSSIIVYGVNASKIVLFIPFLIVFFYILMQKGKDILRQLCFIFSIIIVVLTMVADSFFMTSAVILMRTFGIAGLLTYQYNEFFLSHKPTYFSHVNLINSITDNYPYGDKPLGVVVNSFFEENYSNSNANFWATDGIASFGFEGIILVSVFLGFFFGFWKKISSSNIRVYFMLLLVPFSFIILNVGMFTALFSGGYIIFLFLFLFINIKKS